MILARKKFNQLGLELKGLHEYEDMSSALWNASGVFTGGGNTFLLLRTLYEHNLMPILKERVKDGLPYMGTSAGSNIAGKTVGTTNDM